MTALQVHSSRYAPSAPRFARHSSRYAPSAPRFARHSSRYAPVVLASLEAGEPTVPPNPPPLIGMVAPLATT